MANEDKIYLRTIVDKDFEILFKWLNSPQILYYNGMPFRFNTFAEIKNNYLKPVKNNNEEGQLVIVNGEYKPIGIVFFKRCKPIFIGMDVYIFIGEINNNFLEINAMNSIRSISKYIFKDLGYGRITLHLAGGLCNLEENFKQIGFKREAVVREERFVYGRYIDSIYMGVLKEEFMEYM